MALYLLHFMLILCPIIHSILCSFNASLPTPFYPHFMAPYSLHFMLIQCLIIHLILSSFYGFLFTPFYAHFMPHLRHLHCRSLLASLAKNRNRLGEGAASLGRLIFYPYFTHHFANHFQPHIFVQFWPFFLLLLKEVFVTVLAVKFTPFYPHFYASSSTPFYAHLMPPHPLHFMLIMPHYPLHFMIIQCLISHLILSSFYASLSTPFYPHLVPHYPLNFILI